ncbi:hypothetical protein QUC31_005603 [Theobroma cacao]
MDKYRLQIIALLIGQEAVVSRVNANAITSNGFTPKDVLDLLLQSGGDLYDIHIYQMFQQAGAVKAQEITTGPAHIQTKAESLNNEQILRSCCSWNLWKELMKEVTESSSETKNSLMVVPVLIATITYQAILSPPSGFWSAESKNSTTVGTHVVQKRSRTMTLGEAVMSKNPPIISVFIGFNSIVRVACVSMIITYGSAIFAVTGDGDKFQLALITAAAPLILRCLIQLLVKLKNREPEPPCLIQAFVGPRNKTAEPSKDQTQKAKP